MSDSRIQSTSTPFSPHTPQNDAVAAPRPGPVCSAEQNRIEEAERRFATSTLSPFESALSTAVGHLGPHQSMELSCKTLVSAELAGKIEGKISIERRDDGKYEVTAFAGVQGGVGDEHARAMAGVAAGTKFVVETPEAAADLAQAIATLGGVATAKSNPALFPWAQLGDKVSGASAHALERLDHYRANLVEVKGEARATGALSVKAHSPGVHGHASADAMLAGSVKVDLERGEVSTAFRFELTGEAKAGLDLGHGARASTASAMAFELEAEGKWQGRLEARKHLPPALAERLKRGELSPTEAFEALKNAKTEWVAVVEVEVEKSVTGMASQGIGRIKVTAEVPVNGEALARQILAGDQAALLRPLLDAEWEAEGELGWGARMAVGAEGMSGEATAMNFTKAKTEKGSLAHAFSRASHAIDDQVAMKRTLEARGIH